MTDTRARPVAGPVVGTLGHQATACPRRPSGECLPRDLQAGRRRGLWGHPVPPARKLSGRHVGPGAHSTRWRRARLATLRAGRSRRMRRPSAGVTRYRCSALQEGDAGAACQAGGAGREPVGRRREQQVGRLGRVRVGGRGDRDWGRLRDPPAVRGLEIRGPSGSRRKWLPRSRPSSWSNRSSSIATSSSGARSTARFATTARRNTG